MCLHNPAYEYLMTDMPVRYTPDKLDALISDLEVQSKSLREEQDRILDLYVERTGANRKALQTLMDKDTFIDANRAQELGFITHILVPTTAHRFRKRNIKTKSNNKTMAKPNPTAGTSAKKPSALSRFLAKAGLARAKAQVVTAADGNEFTVEREDGDPQIGDVAYPDGTYVLDDGLKIVVEGEIIINVLSSSVNVLWTCSLFPPSFPAAPTSIRPGPTTESKNLSIVEVPSCGPICEPRLIFITHGFPTLSA